MTATEKRLLHSMLAEGCGVTELFAVIDAMLEVHSATMPIPLKPGNGAELRPGNKARGN